MKYPRFFITFCMMAASCWAPSTGDLNLPCNPDGSCNSKNLECRTTIQSGLHSSVETVCCQLSDNKKLEMQEFCTLCNEQCGSHMASCSMIKENGKEITECKCND